VGNRVQLKMPFKIVTHQLSDDDLKIKKGGGQYIKVEGRRNTIWYKLKDLFRKKREPIYIYNREK